VSTGRQGSKGTQTAGSRQAAERAAERAQARRRLAILLLAAALIASFVIAAVAHGISDPSVDEGEIAVIEDAPDGTITSEDFEAALQQTAARQQIRQVPEPGDPQYELLADAAVSDLILGRWVLGEGEERGIEVSEREVDEELESIKQGPEFGSEKAFQQFLDQSGFTLEQARERIELQLVSDRIQQAVLPKEPEVADEEVEDLYNANIEQFQVPETRDVRVITTKSEADAAEARRRLEADDSVKSFEAVARELSTDEATRSTGGLREGVVAEQPDLDAALDEQIFSAPLDELVGPFETGSGFGVLQVQAINEASTVPLDEAREQIVSTLRVARGQELAQAFQEDFTAKWTARTFCAEEYRIERCANAEPLENPCTAEVADTQGCDAPVPSTRPIPPASAGVFGAPPPPGLPQGPISPQQAAPPGFMPGITPVPGGLPPGAAPPGAAPPGAAPPGAAPPGAPPPGAAPPAPPPGG
jgi:foldase protein PrsA